MYEPNTRSHNERAQLKDCRMDSKKQKMPTLRDWDSEIREELRPG